MTKKEIKLFATDLDGTLFSRPSHLSPYAEETLRTLRKKGVEVAICTGRHYARILNDFPKDTYDYVVSNNGQDVYFVHEDTHTSMPVLNKEEIQQLLPLADKYPVILMASTDTDFITTGSRKNYIAIKLYRFGLQVRDLFFHQNFHRPEINFDVNNIENLNIIKICFSGAASSLRKLSKEIPTDQFSVFFVNKNWLEVQPHGINKGNGIQMIMDHKNLSSKNVCAIGDGENDLSMLEVAGMKVAMENAMPSLKKIATDYAGNYMSDGCAKWVRENLL